MNEFALLDKTDARPMGLRDWADWLARSNAASPDEILDELEALVWGDVAMMREAFAVAGFDLRGALEGLLCQSRHGAVGGDQVGFVEKTTDHMSPAAAEFAGEDHLKDVEKTCSALSSPASQLTAGDRRLIVEKTKEDVSSAVKPSRQNLDAGSMQRALSASAATRLMVIDGTPLGEWTIGRCRTQARRKGREAEMLKRILAVCGAHLPHTTEIGAVIDETELKRIAESIA